MINIENLTKFYGKNCAVNKISFTINDNEIIGFLGPNGAGKSTTMNMITGYLPMSDGKVTICGFDIKNEPVKAKCYIGYLPENPPLYPDMRVNEYLSFCASLKRVKICKRLVEINRVMNLLKIADIKHKLIKKLSKGYKQRVGFAQALIGNPKFLIFDEPTVGLDPNQVIEIRQIIKDLKKEHAVILSSHILSEVSAICNRVVIINNGTINVIDTIENLEKSLNNGLTLLHIKVKGNQDIVTSIINMIKGVKRINKIDFEGDLYSFTVHIDGNNENVKNDIMTAIIKHNIQIFEIYSEKPNLESIFTNLVKNNSESVNKEFSE